MDRLVSFEPSNLVVIRVEPGERSYGVITLRNVMHTMPVAFQLQSVNKSSYLIRPQSGIICPLSTVDVEIVYVLPPSSVLPDVFPYPGDKFVLESVVVPGANVKHPASTYDAIPNEWFAARKKQVFYDSGMRVMLVGSIILAQLVVNGSMEEVREVLERCGTDWRAADSIDVHGQTQLHLAVGLGRADLVQVLLEFGADAEARNQHGQSTLEAAVFGGEVLIVELLLARKCSTERHRSSKWGSVHLAASGGHTEIMRLLLLKGADPDDRSEDGHTALHIAVEERRGNCLRLLLASGVRVNLGITKTGDTPLHLAARLGDEDAVKLLMQNGANKEICNRLGQTPYDVAAEHAHSSLFDVLRFGDSLNTAARKGETRTINWLIENGTSVDGVDQHGWTALHRAAFKGQVNAVKAILLKCTDINAKDRDGYTALHCATESGQAEVIELLISEGADVGAETNKGLTALQIADLLRYSGIIQILARDGPAEGRAVSADASTETSFDNGRDLRKPGFGSVKVRSRRRRSRRSSFNRTIAVTVS